MDDLATWLRAQLDDDERKVAGMEREQQRVRTAPIFRGQSLGWLAGVDIFVSPTRWQAEVDAKRRMLELHVGDHDCTELHTGVYPPDWPAEAAWGKAGESWSHPSNEHFEADDHCPTMRLLALPYADRPGWREEWRPADDQA